MLLRPIAWLTPTFHGVALARGLSLGTLDLVGAVVHVGVLSIYIVVGVAWALVAFRRTLTGRPPMIATGSCPSCPSRRAPTGWSNAT